VTPELVIVDDAAAVARAGVDAFVTAARAAVAERGHFAVALAGGSTPRAMYRLLSTAPDKERVDWPRVEIYFGDERCVPPDHPDSNYRMAKEALLDYVPIDPANVHRMVGEAARPDEAAREYEACLPPRLDLALLGMGADGHTASLFPGTAALEERERPVVAVFVPRLDAWRITLTALYLSSSRQVVVETTGGEKAEALTRALEAPPGAVPIQLVQPERLRFLVDRAAASRLKT
jgi:6-phosphogluconolactonase